MGSNLHTSSGPKASVPPWLLCVAAGVATGVCYWFPELGLVAWVAPAVALYYVGKRRRWCAWAFAVGYAGTAYALAYTVRVGIEGVPLLLTNAGLHLVATGLHAPLFAFALWLAARLPCPDWLRPAAWAVCWAGAEWLTEVGPLAWPLLHLGVTQWASPALAQTASLGGPLLTGAVMMLFAGLLASAVTLRCAPQSVMYYLGAAALAGVVVLFGACTPAASANGPEVALVQWGLRGFTPQEQLASALQLAYDDAQGADVVVLPEGAGGFGFADDPVRFQMCEQAAQTLGAQLVVGAWYEKDGARLPAVYLLNEQGQLVDVAVKQRLVPLYEAATGAREGEVPPPADRVLSSGGEGVLEDGRAGESVGVGEGERSGVPTRFEGESAGVDMGALVCFESLFPSLAREAADGSSLLVVVTSDRSFGGRAPRALHFGYGVLDSLATGRWFVQASTDGMTGAASPAGSVSVLETNDPGVLRVRMGEPRDTLYTQVGEAWLVVAAAILACVSLVGCVRARRRAAGSAAGEGDAGEEAVVAAFAGEPTADADRTTSSANTPAECSRAAHAVIPKEGENDVSRH